MADRARWPELPYAAWSDTLTTLHMWTQIVGKVRMAVTPWINQSWGVALYPTPRGLTTGLCHADGRAFEAELDLVRHRARVETPDDERAFPLEPMAVADFYGRFLGALRDIGLDVSIDTTPNEVERAIPFDEDREHAAYDAGAVRRFQAVLRGATGALQAFRARFRGKCSPVHFFWGGFDLAVTRFSGRAAEPPDGAPVPNMPRWVAREAYSEEVASAGFFPGNAVHPEAAFYAYAYPEPDGFAAAGVEPGAAVYDRSLGEFLLPYEAMRAADDPEAALMAFLESTYQATARFGAWDRDALALGDPRTRFG